MQIYEKILFLKLAYYILINIKQKTLLSTGKCKISDLLEENLARGSKIEFFARPSVDFMLDFKNEGIGQEGKISSLGDVLTNEFVCVLDCTLLPRGVRVGEEHQIWIL